MHFGDQITILPNGIRIAEKELEPIGLYDGSTAFAIWFQDVRARELNTRKQARPDHLVLAPFDVASWPFLVRVELKLDDRTGALSEATAVLRRVGFNILSIDGTPTGHHHATINAIGEALPIRGLQKLNISGKAAGFSTSDRRFQNDTLWDYCCNDLAPAMIGYSTRLIKSLSRADTRQSHMRGYGFLRKTFSDSSYLHRGQLFDPNRLPPDLVEAGKALRPKAVECTWLQSLAYFWLYRDRNKRPFKLIFQKSNRTLAVDDRDNEVFASGISSYHAPFKAIATINSFEQYLRVAISQSDRKNNTVAVSIPFEASFDGQLNTTRGFQNHVFSYLANAAINVRKVSIATRAITPNQEISELELLVSKSNGTEFEHGEPDRVRNGLNAAVNSFSPGRLNVRGSTAIQRLVARRLFVSTSLDWIQTAAKEYNSRYFEIKKSVNWHGYSLVDALNPTEAADLRLKPNATIADRSVEFIRTCDAFLQIIPLEAADKLQWLTFEYGVARALNKPMAICVECNSSSNPDEERTVLSWTMTLKTRQGEILEPFEERGVTLSKAISKALAEIGDRVPSFW